MAEPIRGKVARVLNSREVALSIGTDSGIEVGMFFDILDSKGEEIRDPDSGESLGSIARSKTRVRITKVQEKLSVASTFKTRRVNVGGVGPDVSGFSRVLMPPEWVTEYETLKTEEKTWEDLDEEESYVKVGDPVVQVSQVQAELEEEVEASAN